MAAIGQPPIEIASNTTPLDDYVSQDDGAYEWRELSRRSFDGSTELVLEVTSQRWRTDDEVSRGVWRHALSIVVPDGFTADTALLFISGGANDNAPPSRADKRIREVAKATRTVCALLTCVPNQPTIVYESDEPRRGRYEDDLLAATWNRFRDTEDPTWIAQLAMAKSAVRAMDAIQEALAEMPGTAPVNRFTVAGASKRGWTTWLAAIVDERVAGIAPIVIDMLNTTPSMQHHLACYGKWSRALKDYENQGVADQLGTPSGRAILSIVDPYEYRDRLTLPKVMINASGDEFFLPDSSRFYFDDLLGEKHLSYTPNAGHSLRESNALDTLVAFHASVALGLDRPAVTWTGDHSAAEHTITCSAEPVEATLWHAVNPSARDFRHAVIGDAFVPSPLEPNDEGQYQVTIEAPAEGYSATFARFGFDIVAGVIWRVSTPVWIAPDVEPFAKAGRRAVR